MLIYKFSHVSSEGPVYKGILTTKIGVDMAAEEARRRARKAQMEEAEKKGQMRLEEIDRD